MDSQMTLVLFFCIIGHVTAAGCNVTWDTKWYNTVLPSPSNGWNDTEPIPPQNVIDRVCPPGSGTLKVECMDDNAEIFTGMKTDFISNSSCNVLDGLRCSPQPGINITCPDMSLRIGCCHNGTMNSTGNDSSKSGAAQTCLNGNKEDGLKMINLALFTTVIFLINVFI